jgi:DNA-binding response OmpR family regulator
MTTVLVADDDADTRDLISFKLEQAGYTVLLAATGTAALAQIAAGGVDLALLDVMMPGATGLEVCRQIRADPDTAGLPVIIVTVMSSENNVQAGFDHGADDYLTKPFSPRELLSRVAASLYRASALAHAA